MTQETPLYRIPYPELLVGSADGPAAFKALAERVEAITPTLRAQHENVVENATSAAPTSRTTYMRWSIPINVNGWIDVNFRVDFAPVNDPGTVVCCGGHCEMWINNVAVRNSVRFHNECAKYSQFSCNGSGALSVQAALTPSLEVKVDVSVDPSSYPIAIRRIVAGARVYGSLA